MHCAWVDAVRAREGERDGVEVTELRGFFQVRGFGSPTLIVDFAALLSQSRSKWAGCMFESIQFLSSSQKLIETFG